MNLLHSTWFWCLIIAGPFATVVTILARLSRREPPPVIPGRVAPVVRAGVDSVSDPSSLLAENDQK